MSLGDLTSMMSALERKRGKPKMPSESEIKEAEYEFQQLVANDPSVKLH